MRFTGKEGVVLAAVSDESGGGKTTAQACAAAVWGHPKASRKGLTDTGNSVQGWLSGIRHLPVYWDELKGRDDTERFVKFTFDVSRGLEKSRMKSNAELREQGEWQTLVLVSSNESVQDAVGRNIKSTEAGVLRVFEWMVPKKGMGTHPAGHVDRLVAACHDNFGHAGLEYAKYLGANHDTIAKEVADFEEKLARQFGSPNEERFWVAACTCIYMGARYANMLKLTNINLPGLLQFLWEATKTLRGQHRVNSVSNMRDPGALQNVFQQYLNAMRSKHTLVTDALPMGPGRVAKGSVRILTPDYNRLDTVLVRYATQKKVLLVQEASFREWLNTRQYSPVAVLAAMKERWAVQERQQRDLLAGVSDLMPFASIGKEYCLVVDLNGSGFQHLDEMTVEGNTGSDNLADA
jgi:hypothetical protein